MTILFLTFLLLIASPAALLWLGKFINASTDTKSPRPIAAPTTGEEWYQQKLPPLFPRKQKHEPVQAGSATGRS